MGDKEGRSEEEEEEEEEEDDRFRFFFILEKETTGQGMRVHPEGARCPRSQHRCTEKLKLHKGVQNMYIYVDMFKVHVALLILRY